MKCSVCKNKMEHHMVRKKGFFYKCPKCGFSKEHRIVVKDGKDRKYIVIDEEMLNLTDDDKENN